MTRTSDENARDEKQAQAMRAAAEGFIREELGWARMANLALANHLDPDAILDPKRRHKEKRGDEGINGSSGAIETLNARESFRGLFPTCGIGGGGS